MYTDRNYIMDTDGNYLKIIGNFHPDDCVISYVKYFPSIHGHKIINNKRYGLNSFVAKSFAILGDDPSRVIFSKQHGSVVTCTPIKKIAQVFDCRAKTKEILENKEKYSSDGVGTELVSFLEKISDSVDIKNIGVTGSFLIDGNDAGSDIDLVCYGEETTNQLTDCFKDYTIPYKNEYALSLYKRRMNHMYPMDFELFIDQENRKLQGLTPNKKIHINCQPIQKIEDDVFKNITMIEIGEIECIAKITADKYGRFAPALYSIQITDMLDSLFSTGSDFIKKVKVLVSFLGGYANCFRISDRVHLKGNLIQIAEGNNVYYGIELTPWHTSTLHRASLLSTKN